MDKDQDIIKILEEYLRSKFPERKELMLSQAEKAHLSASHNIFMLTVDWKDVNGRISEDLVIRMEPDMGVHQSYDLGRECEAVKKMYTSGVPVPKLYLFEEDSKILGHPFVLMEKIKGEKLLDGWLRQPEYRPQLMQDLISILAGIHSVDWRTQGLSFLGVPEHDRSYALDEIDRWEQVVEKTQYGPYPVMAEVAVWLKRNAPPSERTTVCHGDYSVLNAHVHEGRIAAVLDWEMAGLGDPVSDIAWLSAMAQDMRIPDWDEARFIRGYEQMSGTKVAEESLAFWKTFSTFKMAAIAVSALRTFIEAKDPPMKLIFTFNVVSVVLQDAAAKSIGF